MLIYVNLGINYRIKPAKIFREANKKRLESAAVHGLELDAEDGFSNSP